MIRADADPSRADPVVLAAAMKLVKDGLEGGGARPFILGICGSQASGKSTLAEAIRRACAKEGVSAATLSIDDLYMTRAERRTLAEQVHPLLATRGPPGTHDVERGLEVMQALRNGQKIAIPRFDKASDDRYLPEEWEFAPDPCDVLVFEGWCVGAVPELDDALARAVNPLEANEDPDGRWRNYANDALAASYQTLFAMIDRLVLLAAPSFDVVNRWRVQQEEELRVRVGSKGAALMDEAAIARFIQHYERLTRHILAEMPWRADLVIFLDEERKTRECRFREASSTL